MSQRWPGAVARLWQENVDIALLFNNTFRSAWVAWLSGCRRRIGFDRYLRGGMLTDRLEPVRDDDGKLIPSPIIDDYNRLVETLGCPDPGYRMELFTTPADEIAADEVWDMFGLAHYNEVICFNPGAAFGSAKHWPSRSFARLARHLIRAARLRRAGAVRAGRTQTWPGKSSAGQYSRRLFAGGSSGIARPDQGADPRGRLCWSRPIAGRATSLPRSIDRW